MGKYALDPAKIKKDLNTKLRNNPAPTAEDIADAIGSLPFCITTSGIFRARNNFGKLIECIKDAQTLLAEPVLEKDAVQELGRDVVNAIINLNCPTVLVTFIKKVESKGSESDWAFNSEYVYAVKVFKALNK